MNYQRKNINYQTKINKLSDKTELSYKYTLVNEHVPEEDLYVFCPHYQEEVHR